MHSAPVVPGQPPPAPRTCEESGIGDPDERTVVVSGLPPSTTTDRLRALCAAAGHGPGLVSCRLAVRRRDSPTRCLVGFLTMASHAQSRALREALDGTNVDSATALPVFDERRPSEKGAETDRPRTDVYRLRATPVEMRRARAPAAVAAVAATASGFSNGGYGTGGVPAGEANQFRRTTDGEPQSSGARHVAAAGAPGVTKSPASLSTTSQSTAVSGVAGFPGEPLLPHRYQPRYEELQHHHAQPFVHPAMKLAVHGAAQAGGGLAMPYGVSECVPGIGHGTAGHCTLFVTGIASDATDRECKHIFRPFPGFLSLNLLRKPSNRTPDTMVVSAFVLFATPAQATLCSTVLTGYVFDETAPMGLRFQVAKTMTTKPTA